MSKKLFADWLESVPPTAGNVPLFQERSGARTAGLDAFKELLADHFIGEEVVLKMGGYAKAATTLKNSLPTTKRGQSGDLGELIATEYIDAKTTFHVPIRKLRWKSDQKMPMHGNDVVGVEVRGTSIHVLKCESKSREWFAPTHIAGAAKGLDGHDGLPNPSTLAFITKRLYEQDRDPEAKVFEALQIDGSVPPQNIEHLIFTFTGRDPSKHLAAAPQPKNSAIKRSGAAVVITDHPAFITTVYGNHVKKS